MTKTSTFSNALIWFGAAVSIAEILTGTYIAPLGMKKGITAIIIGHIIGCALFYFAGLIGAKTGKNSMDTVKLSFGKNGASFFSLLNILQLVGWTAVMIFNGAAASSALSPVDTRIWCVIIGALIAVWVIIDIKYLEKVNIVAMSALFALTVILSFSLFGNTHTLITDGSVSFGSAVELSIAMPLSWLPLISDFTKDAKRPKAATAVSTAVYFFTSCWMYIIGLCGTLVTAEYDVAKILEFSRIGAAAAVIVIVSTVTTTFIDVFSAGESAKSIFTAVNKKFVAIGAVIIGTLLALFADVLKYEEFLYLIGSVFAPMATIQIIDFFVFKKNAETKSVDIISIIIWVIGFAAYQISSRTGLLSPLGYTLPTMTLTAIITIGVGICRKLLKK